MPTERIGLALVATVRRRATREPIERLSDPAALRAWLAEHGLAVDGCSERDLADTRSLREAIYALAEAAAFSGAPEPAALRLVDEIAARPEPRRKLLWNNGFRIELAPLTTRDALTVIARDTVDLLTGPEGARLHQCEADTCGTVFVVPAAGRPRRWCSSASCGNRERVRAYRAARQ
ncbi:CGNR zinc finger domain-containing protein [Nocardia pseudobrasiliensis]|uniref:Putative RNA-binding Zn ribbon-like protein n=1 Tax=Nocardia pseudobrasiliensis TaxID=45979 RepID=A0A370HXT3_9NOCA|nr:ABATE domain-containing protein [Nocardia pseudobrasiliensis]RDI63100.1 putative RNA-binding Zn ribbon-like protein [Nocardia pseudobrasiliensis]